MEPLALIAIYFAGGAAAGLVWVVVARMMGESFGDRNSSILKFALANFFFWPFLIPGFAFVILGGLVFGERDVVTERARFTR